METLEHQPQVAAKISAPGVADGLPREDTLEVCYPTRARRVPKNVRVSGTRERESTYVRSRRYAMHNQTKEPSGYVQCRACKAVLAYDSKKTGTSSLQRHTDRGCTRPTAGLAASNRQSSLSDYLSPAAKSVPASVKSNVTEKCVEFCCRDIRSFHTVAGRGFINLAQDLINVGATYGRVSVDSVLPDPTTISRRCKETAASKRQALVKEISEIMSDITVGMTTDMWTTCHYITPDFLLRSRVLTTAMFPPEEAKTGDNIQRELQRLLVSQLGFDACVMNKVVWVTDQGSNMIAALAPSQTRDREDIQQEARLRIASFTTDNEPAERVAEPVTKRSKIVAEFEEWVNVPLGETADEVTQYSSRNHDMEEERDLLGWWKNNCGVFPLLSKLARSILSIPASSSSSERNFSAAGLTFNQRRTALKPSTVDAVLFLHSSY
ncbi:zinc finger BED domain-containing protein RICESLEEPER 2-like [Pimephales promelas]|nr:zinc finger BED domain-containing protein RICESLEEPER 2-like [Pimephales promelas]